MQTFHVRRRQCSVGLRLQDANDSDEDNNDGDEQKQTNENNNDDDDDVGSSNRISVSDPAAMVQYDYDTGVTTEWLGLNRRSHRFLGIAAGLFMFVSYFFMSAGRIGYIFFPFIFAWVLCMVGCVGCCCVIPLNPDEDDDD